MKKFLAIILAGVMVFALAAPAMAGGGTHTVTFENDGNGTCGITGSNQVEYNTEVTINTKANPGYTFAEMTVTSASGYGCTYYTPTFTMLGEDVTVKVYFVPEENIINRVDVTIDTSIGTNICNATKTITTDIGDGVVAIDESGTMWVRWAPGADPETDTPELILTGSSEVFQDGYTYGCCLYISLVDEENYRYAYGAAKLYVNGIESTCLKGNDELRTDGVVVLITTPAKETTAAPTTAAQETTASTTSPKLGDAMNPALFTVAMIAVAATGVFTVVSARKKK